MSDDVLPVRVPIPGSVVGRIKSHQNVCAYQAGAAGQRVPATVATIPIGGGTSSFWSCGCVATVNFANALALTFVRCAGWETTSRFLPPAVCNCFQCCRFPLARVFSASAGKRTQVFVAIVIWLLPTSSQLLNLFRQLRLPWTIPRMPNRENS